MKVWVPILFVLIVLGIAILWRTRERFSSAATEPICPDGLELVGQRCRRAGGDPNEDGASPVCPDDHILTIENGVTKCEPIKQSAPEEPQESVADEDTGATATPTDTGTGTTQGGVTPTSVRKNTVLGPVFTSYGAQIDGGDPDAWKRTQYPELLGGGDPASRQRQRGGFGIGIGSLTGGIEFQGALPTAGGLGTTEDSRFFPSSRQPGDMELIPDPYRVSQQFSSASYSFKTEPSPFLTDFSAFTR